MMLPELWHVQMSRNGDFFGYFQFFHTNEKAAQDKATELRAEFADMPEFEVHVGRYVLADGA